MNQTLSLPADMSHELTQGFAATVIRAKAYQIARRGSFTASDIPDLEQDMKLRLWTRLSQFDPEKAPWEVFVVTIVERHAATIIQMEQRQKRHNKEPIRLLSEKVPLSDGESTWLAHTLTNEAQEATRGRYVENEYVLVDLRLDLAELIARLPKKLQKFCHILKTHNLREATRKLRISKTTACEWLAQIRAHNDFEKTFSKAEKVPDPIRANAVVKE